MLRAACCVLRAACCVCADRLCVVLSNRCSTWILYYRAKSVGGVIHIILVLDVVIDLVEEHLSFLHELLVGILHLVVLQ